MENFIVKIKSYYQNRCLNCGTGIVIGVHEVLIAAHVISGETHVLAIEGIEIPLYIVRQNNTAVILSTDQSLPFGIAEIFSIHEILDQQTQWTVDGYITSEQQAHKIIGCGIINVGAEDDHWDCNLITIESGIACDYEGLSGAPVLSCGRIVGILQMQTPNSSGILGLQMSSVEMFRDLLNLNNMKPNEYETLILNESQSFSQGQIERNKSNRKYIPDIFVEEGLYKERLRYFADPVLFLKKALMECKRIDFSSLNSYLSQIGSTEINNSMLPEVVLPTQIKKTAEMLSVFLSNTISTINCCDQDLGKRHHSIEQYYTLHYFLNNSLKYYLQDLLESIRFVCLRYLLLTKRAGQGKTNFLCDFTENFLLKKGYCTWYFNAYEFHEPPMHTLLQKLCHHDQFKPAYVNQVLERYWRRTGKPLIIVIDGLNENTSYPNFDRVMCAFLEECNALPFIKIIMSTREELLETRFSSLLHCQEQLPFFHLKMTMKSNDFDHRIFYGYLQFFGIEIRWHTLTHRTFKKLTEDVLLLRFFCEVNEHAHQLYMYDVYKYAVFEQYCVKKAQEYQQDEYVADAAELFYSLLEAVPIG